MVAGLNDFDYMGLAGATTKASGTIGDIFYDSSKAKDDLQIEQMLDEVDEIIKK